MTLPRLSATVLRSIDEDVARLQRISGTRPPCVTCGEEATHALPLPLCPAHAAERAEFAESAASMFAPPRDACPCGCGQEGAQA